MAVLGLRFCARAFSSAASGDHSSSRCAGLSLSRPLLLRSTGFRRAGSVIVAHGPSCSAACGIFPDQGSNPCPLHWQADSQPLRHQGSPLISFFIQIYLFIFGCVGPSLLHAGFLQLWCVGFSLQWLLLLQSMGYRCGLQYLWLSGCRAQAQQLWCTGLSCSAARGIFPEQGSNPCPLHWQADS